MWTEAWTPSSAEVVYDSLKGQPFSTRSKSLLLAAVTVAAIGVVFGVKTLVEPRNSATVAPNVAPILAVSPSGRDARCVRGDASRPCLSFDRAYQLTQPGDVVTVGCGTYGPQMLSQRPGEGPPRVVFKSAAAGCVTVVGDHSPRLCCVGRLYGTSLTLGNTLGNYLPAAPSYVTFQGINWNGQVYQSPPVPGVQLGGHIVFSGGHIWDVNNQENGLFEFGGGAGNMIENMNIGPGCCKNDAIDIGTPSVHPLGDFTKGSAVVRNTGTSVLYVGEPLGGYGIPANTSVKSIQSGTRMTMSSAFNRRSIARLQYGAEDIAARSHRFTIRNNYIHDFTITCAGNPDSSCDNSISQCAYGSNTDGCNHPDGTQITSADGMTITNNKYYGAGCQAIFAATGDSTLESFTGTWLIAGNMIDEMTQCNGGQKAISLGGYCDTDGTYSAGRACWTGDLKILYNTIYSSAGICVACNSTLESSAQAYYDIFGPSFTLEVAGNLLVGASYAFGPFSRGKCTLYRAVRSTFSPTFSHNVVAVGSSTCGADTAAYAAVVNTGLILRSRLSNQTAAGASNAVVNLNLASRFQHDITDSGERIYCGAGRTVSVDLNGHRRPLGRACDIGAAEAG